MHKFHLEMLECGLEIGIQESGKRSKILIFIHN